MYTTQTRAVITTLSLLCSSLSLHAQAADGGSDDSGVNNHSVSIGYITDDVGSRQYSGAGRFSLGKHIALNGSASRLTSSSAANSFDVDAIGGGASYSAKHWETRVAVDQHRGGNSFRQRDASAAFDRYWSRASIGATVFHRSSSASFDSIQQVPNSATNVRVHVDEKLSGNGYGLHSRFFLTDKWTVSAGGMRYDYDANSTARYDVPSTYSPSLLQRIISDRSVISDLAYTRHSNVTRELAVLRSSYDLGLRYANGTVQMTGSLRRDNSFRGGEHIDTAAFGAALPIGAGWRMSPLIGYSRSNASSNIVFGQLVLTFEW